MQRSSHKKKLGGYPALGVVTSITLALFVLGLFGNLLIYSNQFGKIVRDNLNVKVFLKSTLTETQRNQLERTIGGKKFVAQTENAITFISKEDAEKDLIKQIGDYKEILGRESIKRCVHRKGCNCISGYGEFEKSESRVGKYKWRD